MTKYGTLARIRNQTPRVLNRLWLAFFLIATIAGLALAGWRASGSFRGDGRESV